MGGDGGGGGGRGRGRGRGKSGIGDGDDSFRHYMSRKVEMQRRQFGLALPPPPPPRADVDGNGRGGGDETMIGVLGRLRNRHGTDDGGGGGDAATSTATTVVTRGDIVSASAAGTPPADDGDGRRSDLFLRGVVVIVNGYTRPGADALQRMLHRHGGDLEKYETSRITHVVASSLSAAKANMYKRRVRSRVKVVRPEWIVDCVGRGRLLPEADYVLDEVRDANSSPLKRHLMTKRPPAPAAESGNASDHSPPVANEGDATTSPQRSGKFRNGSKIDASAAKATSSWTPRAASMSMSSSASSVSPRATHGERAANVTATTSSSSPPRSSSTSSASQSDPTDRLAVEAAVVERSSEVEPLPLSSSTSSPSQSDPTDRSEVEAAVVERSSEVEPLPLPPSSSPSSSRSFTPQSKAGNAAMDETGDSSSPTPPEIGVNSDGVTSNGRKRLIPTGGSDSPTKKAKSSSSSSSSSPSPYQNANGSIRTVSTDPNFLNSYFASSRLSFIGSFKQRNIQPPQQQKTQHASSSSTDAAAASSSSVVVAGAGTEKRQSFVFHVDMDSFFASVVLRKYPQYRDKPVAIGHGWRSWSGGGGGRNGGGGNGNDGPPSPSRPMPPPPRRPKRQQRPASSSAASGNGDVPSKWSELADVMGRGGEMDRRNYSTSELSTCNYVAREYGIKKGMFLGRARQLCPDLVVLPYDYEGYEEVSTAVSDILHRHADEHGGGVVEQMSCDEFYVFLSIGGGGRVEEGRTCTDAEGDGNGSAARDVGEDDDPRRGDERRRREVARSIAESIRSDIASATRCTASVGVGASRFLAKLATDSAKPDGCHVVGEWRTLLRDLKLRDLPGIGWKMERKLDGCGLVSVRDVWDLGDAGEETVCSVLGPGNGKKLMLFCRGEDPRSDAPPPRKTIGAECNYGVRFDGPLGVDYMIAGLAREVEKRMETVGVKGSRVTLKLKQRMEGAGEPPKFNGCGMCHNLSRSCDAGTHPTRDHSVIAKLGMKLFNELGVDKSDIRGMGIVISKLDEGSVDGGVNSAMSAWLHGGKSEKRVRPIGNLVNGGHRAGVYDSSEHPSSPSRAHATDRVGIDSLDRRPSDGSVAGTCRTDVDDDRSENRYNPKNTLSTTGIEKSDIFNCSQPVTDRVEGEMGCNALDPFVCAKSTSPEVSHLEPANGSGRVSHGIKTGLKRCAYDAPSEARRTKGEGDSSPRVQNTSRGAEVCDLLDDSDSGDSGDSHVNVEELDASPGMQSHSEEDIALPPLSQIDRNEVMALPQPLRDAILKKIKARRESEVGKGNRSPYDDHCIPPLSPPSRSSAARSPPKTSQSRRRKRAKICDAEGGRLRQVSVKRMLKLATVKSGQDTMMEALGDPVSLTQLDALPLRMQLQVVNGDEIQKELTPTRRMIEASSPNVERITTEVRSPVFSEGPKAKDRFSPKVMSKMSASSHASEVAAREHSVSDEVFPESDFYKDNVVPLRKWMDSHPNPGQEEIDKFLEFVKICTAEKRLDEAAAMLRIVKRRRDRWGAKCYRSILDSFNHYLLATEDRRLDLKWHGLI